jgi:hypothetical protein
MSMARKSCAATAHREHRTVNAVQDRDPTGASRFSAVEIAQVTSLRPLNSTFQN